MTEVLLRSPDDRPSIKSSRAAGAAAEGITFGRAEGAQSIQKPPPENGWGFRTVPRTGKTRAPRRERRSLARILYHNGPELSSPPGKKAPARSRPKPLAAAQGEPKGSLDGSRTMGERRRDTPQHPPRGSPKGGGRSPHWRSLELPRSPQRGRRGREGRRGEPLLKTLWKTALTRCV